MSVPDGGSVEGQTVLVLVLVELSGGDGEVLHDTDEVAEADIDHLDAFLLDIGEQVVGTFEHLSSINTAGDVFTVVRAGCSAVTVVFRACNRCYR